MRGRAIIPIQTIHCCPAAEAACAKSPPTREEFEVPGRAEMLSLIRRRVAEFAESLPFSEEDVQDLTVAVGEAAANAIRHGMAPSDCTVSVRIERLHSCIRVSVGDHGCGFDPRDIRPPTRGSLDESGRGIMLMRALVDKVRFRVNHPGVRVELTKFFAPSVREWVQSCGNPARMA